jgi:hypothetical protein
VHHALVETNAFGDLPMRIQNLVIRKLYPSRKRVLLREGEPVPLTLKAFDILPEPA